MTVDGQIEKEIIGKTYEECNKKLEKLYNKDFKITGQTTEWKYDFFRIRNRPYVKLKYIVLTPKAFYEPPKPSYQPTYESPVYNRISEEEQLERNRQKILEQNSNVLLTSQINTKLDEMKQEFSERLNNLNLSGQAKHETIKRIEDLLQENEFSYSYIQMIIEKINATFPMDQLNDFNLVQKYVVDWIGETISVTKPRVIRPPHVYVLVGPTGVGKTTTLTKLMAANILKSKTENKVKPKSCIITIDNIRAGAFDQLKKLGDAVEYPVLKALTAEDISLIYNEYKQNVDYIYVDTAGCSPSDSEHLGIMKNILDVNMNPDVYLTVTASTKTSDLAYIFRNYEPFGYNSVIVTKVDESRQIGNIISILWEKHKSISYFTNGQHPKNIKAATVVDMLLNLSGFDIDRIRIENKFGKIELTD